MGTTTRQLFLGLFISLLVLAAGRAGLAAELTKAERPVLKVGDTWVRKQANGEVLTLTVKAVTDTGAVYTVRKAGEDAEREWHISKDHNLERIVWKGMNLETYAPGLLTFSWPLEVGRTWKGSYTSSLSGPVSFESRVVGVETVKTPAGTFEAFKIVREQWGETRGFQWRGTLTYWYAPKVKSNVKSAYTSDRVPILTYDLIETKVSAD